MDAATDMLRGSTILTSSRRYFDFLHPERSEFGIDDIATGLANTCRFAGQPCRYYSVAEHSVYVSQLVADEHKLAALLHDAAEAFICDMPKPLKEILPDYKAVEKRVEAAVFARFGLPAELDPSIKHADRVMLATEQRQIMFNDDDWEWTHDVEPAPIHIFAWQPADARAFFMNRWFELTRSFGA